MGATPPVSGELSAVQVPTCKKSILWCGHSSKTMFACVSKVVLTETLVLFWQRINVKSGFVVEEYGLEATFLSIKAAHYLTSDEFH